MVYKVYILKLGRFTRFTFGLHLVYIDEIYNIHSFSFLQHSVYKVYKVYTFSDTYVTVSRIAGEKKSVLFNIMLRQRYKPEQNSKYNKPG